MDDSRFGNSAFHQFFTNIYLQSTDFPDKRLSHLPLMDSPLPYAILFVVYFYATKIGPKLMEPRKPLNIKRIIIIYNIIQIFLNGLFSIKVRASAELR